MISSPWRHLAGCIAVDRAIGDWRRGLPIIIRAGDAQAMMLPAEGMSAEIFAYVQSLTPELCALLVSSRRARALGVAGCEDEPAAFVLHQAMTLATIQGLADPLRQPPATMPDLVVAAGMPNQTGWRQLSTAAITLAKLAEQLPAVVVVMPPSTALPFEPSPLTVDVDSIMGYRQQSVAALQQVAQARVPLAAGDATQVMAFRPGDGGPDHLAILIGAGTGAPLVRLHSSCVTGDVLGSLRCDCGDQLHGALNRIAAEGWGIILYLVQEGRGIGIANKLRAYQLQDRGFDTLDANGQLGFEADERSFAVAAAMLRALGHGEIRLMTNNPTKVAALTHHGIHVRERVPHIFAANEHNRHYLQTKAARAGHLF